ncbi:Bgt-2393 [Blumeria graminis f. sp. tritici]|uniref:Bgt-2393 n=2 Tax=Blumeria graminis f. sp. tritici TaxID=62690 RepID=A0A061HMZ4_BLUGR|nr:hypothetical protein BGT96224_2393 [Blumeria graminis f. sp. tritici 96224]VDB95026.1 Bgt-2393 [Blumeria graminis f. sp. tritici]
MSSSSSSSSSPRLRHKFYPPFYGRPPTPLPPSPSLTSLLRPSRPTTPDTSDCDEPLPRASPTVPTYEYYGFVLYLFSSLSFLIYLLWSYLPSPFLHALGLHYYPNRWWSLALPAFLVMLLLYIYVALACYNTAYLTLPLASLETIVDSAAHLALLDRSTRPKKEPALDAWREVWASPTDAVMDIPLGGVCEVLYGSLAIGDDEEEHSS